MNFEELYAQLFDNDGKDQILATGYQKLDKFLGGGFGAELVAISSRPLHGKSTLLLNLMLNFSYYQQYKGIFVAPMSNMPSLVKYLASIIEDKEPNDEYWEAEHLVDTLSDIKSLFRNRVKLDFKFQDLEEVLTEAITWKASYVMIDDFLGVMGFAYSPSLFHELLCRIKLFTQEHGIPVFISLLAQPTVERRGGPQNPMLMDLYRSDLLCHQAHKVIMLYQPMVIGLTEDHIGQSIKGLLGLNFAKNSTGRSGTVTMELKDSGKINDTDRVWEI